VLLRSKYQSVKMLSLVGIVIQLPQIFTDTVRLSLKKIINETQNPWRNPCSRTDEKDCTGSLFTLSRCSLFFFFSRQTARHGSSRFFRNAFQRDSRLSRVVCLRADSRGKITRGMGDKVHDGTTGAIRSCPLPFRTHNAPRAAQGKFNGRRWTRKPLFCTLIPAYTRDRILHIPYVHRTCRKGGLGKGGSKKHSCAFPAPGNTVNVNSMSYGDARKMEEHAVKISVRRGPPRVWVQMYNARKKVAHARGGVVPLRLPANLISVSLCLPDALTPTQRDYFRR